MSGQRSTDEILIFIMRHGEAESLRIDDKSRQLTPTGREQSMTTAQWLVSHYCPSATVDFALVSPFRRARQTFDMVSLDVSIGNIEYTSDIEPDGDPSFVHDYIDAVIDSSLHADKPIQSLLLVSHMPFVSFLLDELNKMPVSSLFATGSVAVLKYDLALHKGELLNHFQGIG